MPPQTTVTPVIFEPPPSQFAIRTLVAKRFVTARLGGGQNLDALITIAQAVGPDEKFIIEGLFAPPTRFKTSGGFYVVAANGGGIGGNTGEDIYTFTTAVADPGGGAWFEIHGPIPGRGIYTLTTFTGNYVTAVDGGGLATRAFHTDAVRPSTWEEFYITKVGDLGSGYYYAIRPVGINDAPAAKSAYVFLNALGEGGISGALAVALLDCGPTARFRLIRQANGSYAIQTPDGIHYVTADEGGGLAHGSPATGNLQTNRTVVQAWEQFKFLDQGNGLYTIQTVSGFYLGVALNLSNISTRISDPDAAPSIGYTARFELMVINPATRL